MRKTFILSLLGALLFLGAQSAWADDTYVVAGTTDLLEENWNASTTVNVMSDNGAGSYTFTKTVYLNTTGNNYQFKVVKNGSAWYPGDNVTVTTESNGWYDVTFSIVTSTNEVSWSKVATEATLHEVTVNLTGIEANTANFYSFVNWGSSTLGLGPWPGQAPNASNQWTVDVLDGRTLFVVFKDYDSDTQSADIKAGVISSDGLSYTYKLDADDYGIHSLIGDFNDWCFGDIFDDGVLVKNLSAGYYDFKVFDEKAWYGWGEGYDNKIFEGNDYKDVYTENNNLKLHATTAGDYVFGWAPEVTPKILFVTYPGSYTRYMTVAHPWATICLPYTVSAEQRAAANATFYSINYKDAENLYLAEETGALVAGRPYIFHFNGESDGNLTIACGTTAYAVSYYNGLIGTYKKVRVATDYYMIIDGQVRRVSATSEAYCDATKAYINANFDGVPTSPTPAPGQRIIAMPLVSDNATNIGNLDASEGAVKFFENGQLRIRRNGVVYDVTGAMVK